MRREWAEHGAVLVEAVGAALAAARLWSRFGGLICPEDGESP
jgi:hypothetical protein